MIDSDAIPMIICWFARSDAIPQTIVRQLLDNYNYTWTNDRLYLQINQYVSKRVLASSKNGI